MPQLEQTITTAAEAAGLVRELREDHPFNVLLLGAKGAGKTMLARRIAAAQPPLEGYNLAQVSWMRHGCLRWDVERSWDPAPPFRAPHHTCTNTSSAPLFGQRFPRDRARPGEISLAHGGVLFLDEVAEWPKHVIEDVMTATRRAHPIYPTSPHVIVGASTFCPCGGVPEEQNPREDERKLRCRCAPCSRGEQSPHKNGNHYPPPDTDALRRRRLWRNRLHLDFWDRIVNLRLPPDELQKLSRLPTEHAKAQELFGCA